TIILFDRSYLLIAPLQLHLLFLLLFFFNDTPPTEIYTLSLHDALPICARRARGACRGSRPAHPALATRRVVARAADTAAGGQSRDRKSTRLNSSHDQISYAVFCLKKKIQR